jgi:hypothetical protein
MRYKEKGTQKLWWALPTLHGGMRFAFPLYELERVEAITANVLSGSGPNPRPADYELIFHEST